MTRSIPAIFLESIQDLVPGDFSRFRQELIEGQPHIGLRLNKLKLSPQEIPEDFPAELEPLPWIEEGFLAEEKTSLGRHPYHLAGLYYLQEPSAMMPVAVLDPQPGERILDLCAAPGGKTTQIATKLANQGWLLANDPNPGRAQSLIRNLERWGVRNAAVTIERPARLADHFGPYFDRVLVDAPCSGEGTFRINPQASREWSPSFVQRCTEIQDDILWQAAKMVKPGGMLVYSTCTFNSSENEGRLERFLSERDDFALEAAPLVEGFSPGLALKSKDTQGLVTAVRIWPHLASGEGHFAARLRKKVTGEQINGVQLNKSKGLSGSQRDIFQDFVDRALKPVQESAAFHPGNPGLSAIGSRLYFLYPESPDLSGLRIGHWGWWLGSYRGESFHPSPALLSGLNRADFQKVLEFPIDDPDLIKYQRGSPINLSDTTFPSGEWIVICAGKYPLGWGKIQKSRLKSYLPNWLR